MSTNDLDLMMALSQIFLIFMGLCILGTIAVVAFYEALYLAMENHDKHLLDAEEDAEFEEALAHFGETGPVTTINVKEVI